MPGFVVVVVEMGMSQLFAKLALNLDPLDLYLLCSWDYRYEPLCPDSTSLLNNLFFQ
jgi:hypothetical protein